MLAESVERINADNNNNNTNNHSHSFGMYPKQEDKPCDTDEESIDVELESDLDDCPSERAESDDPEPHAIGRDESRTSQCLNDSDSSRSSPNPRSKSASPANLSDHHDFSTTVHGRPAKTSRLSFGIDRILHEENEKPPPQSVRTSSGLAKPVLSPAPPKHLSSVAATHQRTLPLDLVSPLNPFHGSLIGPDVCRMDSSSLEMLPVRPAWPDVYVCPWTGVQRDRFGLVRRVGHPYQNRTPPKRKKPRTAFTRQQVLELEKRFTRQKYLASAERSALAKTLNMTDAQVKTWFQNRRTKWRRQTAEEREIERQAAHKFLMSLRQDDSNRPSMTYGNLCGVGQSTPLPGSDSTAPSVVAGVN